MEEDKTKSKLQKILTLSAAILIIIVGFLVFQKPEWQTYENSRYKFTVDYPNSWQLGEPEINNSGRNFFPADKKIECRAYGFANALTMSDGETQTLDEFIEWLTGEEEVIQQRETSLGGTRAIELISRVDGMVRHGVYVLGKDSGLAVSCFFNELEEQEKFAKEFNRMVKSFTIETALDETVYCDTLTNGVFLPVKDRQTFIDKTYTEVTITSREYWDKNKLPNQVLDLETIGYFCIPMPSEFGESNPPAVISVEWNCELEYEDYEYLSSDKERKQGFTCEKQTCLNKTGEEDFVWFCYK